MQWAFDWTTESCDWAGGLLKQMFAYIAYSEHWMSLYLDNQVFFISCLFDCSKFDMQVKQNIKRSNLNP